MAYTKVHIVNSTGYPVTGTVSYVLCKHDDYKLDAGPGPSWTASSRGVCLVKQISAVVQTKNGNILASPYTSSGTAYSQFIVCQLSPTQFIVTRITSPTEESDPVETDEPKEQ